VKYNKDDKPNEELIKEWIYKAYKKCLDGYYKEKTKWSSSEPIVCYMPTEYNLKDEEKYPWINPINVPIIPVKFDYRVAIKKEYVRDKKVLNAFIHGKIWGIKFTLSNWRCEIDFGGGRMKYDTRKECSLTYSESTRADIKEMLVEDKYGSIHYDNKKIERYVEHIYEKAFNYIEEEIRYDFEMENNELLVCHIVDSETMWDWKEQQYYRGMEEAYFGTRECSSCGGGGCVHCEPHRFI
jgi:hypothetical protein